MNPLLISDAYKQSHIKQYPKGTTLVYSNWTPRSDKYAATEDGVVVFGIQAFLKKITAEFETGFFNKPEADIVASFRRGYRNYFGEEPDVQHVIDLHKLGYLPVKVKALPEGSLCPIGVPMLTIYNTLPNFFWVTNFLETIMSAELWLPMTSATIARGYKLVLEKYAEATCDNKDHIPFQGHDFSMRGMSNYDAAKASGAGHLLSFVGSDTIPAVDYLEEFYGAESSKELVACSIPATEHSVMSMGTKEDELGTFRRLITEIYPKGIVAIVSDTWDLWKVCAEYLPALKEEILARDGKVVIRPDSGNPEFIICGEGFSGSPKNRGVIQVLWDVFGGTVNEKGYKVLDSHIGAIYGDAITLEIADRICHELQAQGFASSNIVFGIGSYTYQYNTRDTYGFAMKATYGEVNGVGREIYKDPVTDDGTKKSLRGLLCVTGANGAYTVKDRCTWDEEMTGELGIIYINGKFWDEVDLKTIRKRLAQQLISEKEK